MTNRTMKLVWVVSASVIAGTSIASILVSTAGAADECLAKPNNGTRPGQHWYYRLDRSSKRQCWYLREKDDASPQMAASAPPEKTPSLDRRNDSSMTRSTADAYAAVASPGGKLAGDAQNPAATQSPPDRKADGPDPSQGASPASEQSPVASRWPDSTDGLVPAIDRPASSSFAIASATPDPTADSGPEGSRNTADISSMAVSLQMLLLAALGALAFSGLMGGALYVVRTRRRPQHDDAPSRSPGWSPSDDAYRLYAPLREASRVVSPRGADARQVVDRMSRGDNGHEIAELLARFARQAEAER